MKIHNISLKSLLPKGKVSLQIENDELRMLTLEEGLSKKQRSFVCSPDLFKLPFRVDMKIKVNSPMFKFKIGKGHIMFTGSLNRSGRAVRRADIFTGREEQTKYDFDHVMPMDEYFDLSVVCGSKMTWLTYNGQCCFSSKKAPYIAMLENNTVPEDLRNGLGFAIACGENVALNIKSLTFTEYEHDEPPVPAEIESAPELSAFEWYLKSLPHEVRDSVIKTDEFLMKDMKAVLKFKKSIDKDCKLTYESPCGFIYALHRYEIGESHAIYFGRFAEVLEKLAETSPEFAARMFANINENVSGRGGDKCAQCTVISCANMKTTEYNGAVRRSCGGSVQFEWLPTAFEDVRKVVTAAEALMR